MLTTGPDGDSYFDIADADTYHGDYGNAALADLDTAAKERAARRGTAFIDAHFGLRFPGVKSGGYEQARAWPRRDARSRTGESIPADAVPREIVRAAMIAALREAGEPGILSPDYVPGEQIKRFREQVGPLVEETEYAGGVDAAKAQRTMVSEIEDLLSGLLVMADRHVTGFVV